MDPPGSSVHGFPRQKHWSGLPFPSPGDLPDPGIEPRSLALAGGFFTSEPPGKPIAGDTPPQRTSLPGHAERVYLLTSVSPTLR